MSRSARSFVPLLALLTALLLGVALPLTASADIPTTPSVEGERAEAAKAEARPPMESWLHLIDTGEYIQSWKAASEEFQLSVGAGRWSITCRNLRRPTGEFVGRKVKEVYYHTEYIRSDGHRVPGEMVTFVFDTEFQHFAAKEIVILRPENGSEWKVVSYLLKPSYE